MKTSMQGVKEITNEVQLGPCRTSLQYQFVPQGGAASQCHLNHQASNYKHILIYNGDLGKEKPLEKKKVIFIESFSQNLQMVITKKVFK